MAKLSLHNFYDLPKGQHESIRNEFNENYNPAYLDRWYSHKKVDAEVVLDEDGKLYDIRVFDPFGLVKPRWDEGIIDDHGVNIGADGWSDWLLAYTDPEGNDVDSIIENYNGEPQCSPDKHHSVWCDWDYNPNVGCTQILHDEYTGDDIPVYSWEWDKDSWDGKCFSAATFTCSDADFEVIKTNVPEGVHVK